MRIASPCHVGWENMKGDDRTRFCGQCSLHVYNISAMTRDEVASLIANSEGRICARLYRRADGTVLTRDCPLGLRALRRRVSKAAGAAITALLSLCSVVVGQSKSQDDTAGATAVEFKIKREATQDGRSAFAGSLVDAAGAAIPAAEVTLVNEQTGGKLTASSDPEGKFKFSGLSAGRYSLEIKGFKLRSLTSLEINPKELVLVDVTLEPEEGGFITGYVLTGLPVVVRPLELKKEKDDVKISNGTTTIGGDIIQRLPLP
ncbi:MAG TPA: carboxypeptidase-like regulatory domain-containing protein [Pyrinomonadaceae bacterium]|nr:carboxypeptidase-like regulatory domain-containing protein [Pyrinomonadaceae bacterium]